MKTSPECERVRLTLMASLDGEGDPAAASDQQHLSACPSCQRWLADLQAMTGRLEGLSYPADRRDVWAGVERQIRQGRDTADLARWLWPIGGSVLAWRALQLFVDLPLPVAHPLVPLAAAAAVVWLVTGDALAIQTSAPELQKGGA